MTIKIVYGNLLENSVGAEALAHGVNCEGVMGAGIAFQFRNEFPLMYETYKHLCSAGMTPGYSCLVWDNKKDKDDPKKIKTTSIFLLTTQLKIGANAKIEYVTNSLLDMKRQANATGISSIAIPKIGCGIGGLNFKNVLYETVRIFAPWHGTLCVYLLSEKEY